VEGWVNVSSFPSASSMEYLIGKGYLNGVGSEGYYLRLNGGALEFGTYVFPAAHGVGWTYSGWSTSSWHHVAGTFDGSTWKLYLDQAATASASDAQGPVDNGMNVLIGAFNNSNVAAYNDFNGFMQEVRVSNVARSAAWIATEVTNQSSPASFYSVQ